MNVPLHEIYGKFTEWPYAPGGPSHLCVQPSRLIPSRSGKSLVFQTSYRFLYRSEPSLRTFLTQQLDTDPPRGGPSTHTPKPSTGCSLGAGARVKNQTIDMLSRCDELNMKDARYAFMFRSSDGNSRRRLRRRSSWLCSE